MSRKALIVIAIIGFVVIIAAAVLIFGKKELSTQTETQNSVGVATSTLSNGWQLIKSESLGLSVTVPPAWRVGHVNGNIEAILGDGENQELGIGAELIVYAYDNPSSLTPEDWLKQKGITSLSRMTRNGVEGISYEAKTIEKFYRDGKYQSRIVENTYALGNIFLSQGKIIEVTCALSGPNYKTMIPACGEIVNSLQFIQ